MKSTNLRESLEKYSSKKDFCLQANGLLPNTSVFTGGHMNECIVMIVTNNRKLKSKPKKEGVYHFTWKNFINKNSNI